MKGNGIGMMLLFVRWCDSKAKLRSKIDEWAALIKSEE